MADTRFEAFSLTHAEVLDGSTRFLDVATNSTAWGDVYGVDSASIDGDADSYTNEGDDVEMSEWNWIKGADLNIRAGYMSFALIANITGQTISSSGAGASQILEQDLWHEDSFNVADRPVILRMPSRDAGGVIRTFDVGLYKCSFRPITFDGPGYKDGLKVNYVARARMSATNELGAAFADGKKRIGRLISRGAT